MMTGLLGISLHSIAILVIIGMIATAYASEKAAPNTLLECHPPENGETVQLPDCRDCTKYYSCVGALPVSMPCPAGLHFNAVKSVCDMPQSACCEPKWDPKRQCKKYSGVC